MYKLVSQSNVNMTNIGITGTVRVRDASDDNNDISTGYHYGGIMIRNPTGDTTPQQNFVFIAVGYQDSTYPCQNGASNCIETKSTTNNAPVSDRLNWV